MSSPLTLPLMQAGRLDGAELFRQWVQLVDYNVAKRIIQSPEQSAAAQTVLQAAQIASEAQGTEPPSLI